jgi:acyl carrier protein
MTVLETFLQAALATALTCEPNDVSITEDFGVHGVDSLVGLRFARRIQDHLGREIEIEWLYDHPSIAQLAAFLETLPRVSVVALAAG